MALLVVVFHQEWKNINVIKTLKLLIVFIFLAQISFAQTLKIEGLVKDNKNVPLSSSTLQLKNQNLDVITYSFTNVNGNYALTANLKNTEKLYLIASYLGFKKDTLVIRPLSIKENLLHHDFVLQTDENQLNEISIEAPKPKIEVVNDTTKYNVKSFTTPDDRNLESVIKKMPGMEVTKDGTIYYKQKQVSKVLLESDDLTGSNYKAITQNLNPELVNEVQAIEHWVEDDLLKGIINSDDIVLNLTLKDKRKQKIIGSLDVGYGTDNRTDLSTNLITFVNKTKAYAFVRNNNIGSSQEDIFRLAGANRKIAGDGKLINHQILTYNPFDGETLALNNSLAGSINSITRFTTAFKLSANFYGLQNKLKATNNNSTIFYEPLNAVIINQQDQSTNNKQYQADLNADYLVAKNARFTAKLSYKYKPQEFNGLAFSSYNSVIGNQVSQLQKDKLFNYNADLKYTWKTNATAALILTAKLQRDDIDQNYNPESNLYSLVPAFSGVNSLLQKNTFINDILKVDAQALKKNGYHYFYANFGAEYNGSTLNSNLFNAVAKTEIDGFLNNNLFKNYKTYFAGKYTFDNRKILFGALAKLSLVNQQTFNNDNTFFVFEPDISLSAKIATRQNLSFRYNYRNTYANPLDYYTNPILTDIRSINSGVSELLNYGTHNANFSYSNSELSDRYFSFNVSSNLQYSNVGFLNNNFFENTIFYTQKIPYKGLKNISGNLGMRKFLPVLSSNITLDYTPSLTSYFGKVSNIINSYTSVSQTLVSRASTGFNIPVNFALEFQFQNNSTSLAKQEINNQNAYKYSFQARYNVSKTLFHLTDFGLYKINGQNYHLLNSQIQYNPSKGLFKYAIYGKNLLDVKSIDNAYVDNLSISRSTSSILGRYILGSVSMSIK